jgi:hypothetical protein
MYDNMYETAEIRIGYAGHLEMKADTFGCSCCSHTETLEDTLKMKDILVNIVDMYEKKTQMYKDMLKVIETYSNVDIGTALVYYDWYRQCKEELNYYDDDEVRTEHIRRVRETFTFDQVVERFNQARTPLNKKDVLILFAINAVHPDDREEMNKILCDTK